jgi:hypothetical protein
MSNPYAFPWAWTWAQSLLNYQHLSHLRFELQPPSGRFRLLFYLGFEGSFFGFPLTLAFFFFSSTALLLGLPALLFFGFLRFRNLLRAQRLRLLGLYLRFGF